MKAHDKTYQSIKIQKQQHFLTKLEERKRSIVYDSTEFQGRYYKQIVGEIEQQKWDQKQKARQRQHLQNSIKMYMHKVHEEHLP